MSYGAVGRNKKTEACKLLVTHSSLQSHPGAMQPESKIPSCKPGVWKILMLTFKPVVFLCDPALPIQDKSSSDKTPAAVFIFVFMVGLLYAGDKLVEVNGVPVEGLEPEQVINILVFIFLKFLLCTLRLYMRKSEFSVKNFRCFLTVNEVHNCS